MKSAVRIVDAMGTRAIWKGSLKIGADRIPVKLYSAVEDCTIHFHVLEKTTLTRVKQKMVNPETGEEVPRDKIKKGYKIERGVYVILAEDEVRAAEPEESRQIEITRFVPATQISHQWYDRPYYLGPDENDAPAYFSLAEALQRNDHEGVARWVMRKKQYVGALRSEGGHLMLITLRFAEEVLSAQELPRPAGRPPDQKELKMAEQLVAALEDEFRAEDFHDKYRERVMKFIQAKAQGQRPRLKIVARKKQAKSLTESLAASVNIAKRQKEKAAA